MSNTHGGIPRPRRSSGIALVSNDTARQHIRKAFQDTLIRDFAPLPLDPVWLSPNDELILAITVFGRSSLSSIPILDGPPLTHPDNSELPVPKAETAIEGNQSHTNQRHGYGEFPFVGILHLADVVSFIASKLGPVPSPQSCQTISQPPTPPSELIQDLQISFGSFRVSDVLNFSVGSDAIGGDSQRYWEGERHTVFRGDLDSHLLPVCRPLLRLASRIHVVALVDPESRLLHLVIDDTMLLQWIYQKRESIGLTAPLNDKRAATVEQGAKTYMRRASWGGTETLTRIVANSVVNTPIKDVFRRREVLTVQKTDPVWLVLRKMLAVESSAAAVVDESGVVISSLSRSDLKICLCGERPPSETLIQLQGVPRYLGPDGATYMNCVAPGPLHIQLAYLQLSVFEFIGIVRRYTLEATVPTLELQPDDTVMSAVIKLASTRQSSAYIATEAHHIVSVVTSRDVIQAIAGGEEDGGLPPDRQMPFFKQGYYPVDEPGLSPEMMASSST